MTWRRAGQGPEQVLSFCTSVWWNAPSVQGGTASPTLSPELQRPHWTHRSQHPRETFLSTSSSDLFLTLTSKALRRGRANPAAHLDPSFWGQDGSHQEDLSHLRLEWSGKASGRWRSFFPLRGLRKGGEAGPSPATLRE